MAIKKPHIYKSALLWVCAALLALPAAAYAFRVEGQVVNGTTGAPLAPATIIVVNPSGGMMVEKQVQTNDDEGHFVVEDLDNNAPIYLLRVTYKGINYNEALQFHGHDPQTVKMTVYEPTDSWDNVHVSIPHFVVVRSGDTLLVDKFYEIANETSPPMTVSHSQAPFTFYIPEDVLQIAGFNVMSMGTPVPLTPQPTGETGFYKMNYPVKPGKTQVSMSLALPYTSGTYTYRERPRYPIDELVVVVGDPTIEVLRGDEPLERGEDFHGYATYKVAGLSAGSELDLTIRGGTTVAVVSGGGGAPRISIVPNRSNTLSLLLLITLVSTLIVVFAFVAMRPQSLTIDEAALSAQKESLLNQLAKLDDLHKMGTVSDKIYVLKRDELMSALAQIYYRTQFATTGSTSKEKDTEGAARV